MENYIVGNVRRLGRAAYWYITLTVSSIEQNDRQIEFIVDTGRPRAITFSQATMNQQHLEKDQAIQLFGQNFNVVISEPNTKYQDMNVLGAEFFITTKTRFKEINK